MKFIHAADLHLDSPLTGLQHYEGCPAEEIRAATRRALENLVQLALDERANLVLLAGDQFDGAGRDFNSQLFFVRQMNRLHEAGIPVVAISGNHDAQNKMTKALRTPPSFRLLSAGQPETATFEDLGIAVHGQSYARSAVSEDLAANYPTPITGLCNIGLLHTAAHFRGVHDPYAPCSVVDLQRKGYSYWALGHIHQRQRLANDPPIFFSGNLQGRHARETGAKGCLLVSGDPEVFDVEFRPVDVFRWDHLRIDVSDASSADDAVAAAIDGAQTALKEHAGLPLAIRIEFTGASAVHEALAGRPDRWINQLRADAPETVWIEKVKFATTPCRPMAEDDDLLAEVSAALKDLNSDEHLQQSWLEELRAVQRALPDEAKSGPDGFCLDDPELWKELLELAPAVVAAALHRRENAER